MAVTPQFTLTLTEWEAAIVERILHTFANSDEGTYEDISTATKFSWDLMEQASEQGVEFPEY